MAVSVKIRLLSVAIRVSCCSSALRFSLSAFRSPAFRSFRLPLRRSSVLQFLAPRLS
jgi:hypothetical protein